MVSAVPRIGVHGEILPQGRLQRKADRHAHLRQEEHRRKFTTERAGFQVVKDPKDKAKLALAVAILL